MEFRIIATGVFSRQQQRRRPVLPSQAKALRRVLYGSYALVRLHIAKEEEV